MGAGNGARRSVSPCALAQATLAHVRDQAAARLQAFDALSRGVLLRTA